MELEIGMARKLSLEDSLDRIAELRESELVGEDRAELGRFLSSKHSHAVAAAAKIVGDLELEEFRSQLVDGFERLMIQPIKRDPGCRGKAAIAEALHQLEAHEVDLFLNGVKYRQMEAVWGGRQDTAADLRTACGRGLVRMRYVDVLLHLADLLADPETQVRIAAAQSVAYYGTAYGLPLLRLRVRAGDSENEVIAECMLSMMRISAESSIDFVADFLRDADLEAAESAALALGESRADGALTALCNWRLEAAERGLGDVVMTAIAMLRSEEAIDYLVSAVANEAGPVAREVIAAFSIHRHNQGLMERLKKAAQENQVDLSSALEELFEDD